MVLLFYVDLFYQVNILPSNFDGYSGPCIFDLVSILELVYSYPKVGCAACVQCVYSVTSFIVRLGIGSFSLRVMSITW